MSFSDVLAVASYGRSAGSSRVRLFEWLDYLKISAREETYINGSTNSFMSLSKKFREVAKAEFRLRKTLPTCRYDTTVLSRRASPFSNGDLEAKLLNSASLGVYDFDDSIGSTPRVGIQKLWSQAETWKKSVKSADVVIAGNEILANQVGSLNSNVVVIPSCVHPDDYRRKESYSVESPTAIWIGSPSTEYYLSLIVEPLLKLYKAIGLQLIVISSGTSSLGPLEPMVKRVQWTNSNYRELMATADVGLMPLSDSEWARGKCAYKLLQYGAAGLPMIGTPVGANRDVLSSSGNMSASEPEDWYEELDHFFKQSDKYRMNLGNRAFEIIDNRYSFHAWRKEWQKATGLT